MVLLPLGQRPPSLGPRWEGSTPDLKDAVAHVKCILQQCWAHKLLAIVKEDQGDRKRTFFFIIKEKWPKQYERLNLNSYDTRCEYY